jgi:hypothetical protein
LRRTKETPAAVWLAVGLGLLLSIVGLAVLWMRRTPEPEVDADEEDEDEDDVTSSVEAVDQAQQLVAVKDYRAAVRYLFLALLLALDERKLLRFDHTRTNRELLRDTRSNPTLSAALAPVTAAFDRVWYGFEPFTQSDYETLVEQIESLKQL